MTSFRRMPAQTRAITCHADIGREGGGGSQEKGWDKELYDKQPDSTGHRSPEFLVRCMRLHEKERWEVKIKSKL